MPFIFSGAPGRVLKLMMEKKRQILLDGSSICPIINLQNSFRKESGMLIRSKNVWYADGFRPADLVISEGKIEAVYPYGKGEGKLCQPDEVRDYDALRVLPGFIDIHTHGAYGYDTNDGDPEGLKMWARRLPEEGVTAFLPTTVTDKHEVLLNAASSVKEALASDDTGAEILGLHLEGPFFDAGHKGAQPQKALRPASIEEFRQLQEASGNAIRYLSLAPEQDEDFRLTRYCASMDIRVSIGHSGADFDTALMAVANGVTCETHVFNGMPPFHHREPGLAGAALRIRDIYGEIICDCLHVHPDVLNIYFRSKGPDKCIMISDSLRCKKAETGAVFAFGGQQIHLDKEGQARLSDGTIAGSTLSMNMGLKNLVEICGISFDAAIRSCTSNPAAFLGISDRKGVLQAGHDADIVVLDEEYRVVGTYCMGRDY